MSHAGDRAALAVVNAAQRARAKADQGERPTLVERVALGVIDRGHAARLARPERRCRCDLVGHSWDGPAGTARVCLSACCRGTLKGTDWGTPQGGQ